MVLNALVKKLGGQFRKRLIRAKYSFEGFYSAFIDQLGKNSLETQHFK